ncbi:MAG: nucleotidyltransferase [Clostridia bacterium]|nr:nucleotidyltransferase [Clostridia bacterium]
MDTALVIMAAGIGSRFGGGIKQLEPVGPGGEIIMDYSIHDALEAGFNKVVFIIRHDIEEDFIRIIGNRIKKVCPVEYAFQEIDNLPDGFSVPEGRTKPWGTGQAILACKNIVKEPFVIINADDYYGKEAFVKVHDFLVNNSSEGEAMSFCMAGFILKNTLSDNGGVTRGICIVDENEHLTGVEETYDIVKTDSGAAVQNDDGTLTPIDPMAHVSMNMWGVTPEIFDVLEKGFPEFLEKGGADNLKGEYLLPTIIDGLIKSGKADVAVLESRDRWFGVTYREDKAAVAEAFRRLIADGVYSKNLYEEGR